MKPSIYELYLSVTNPDEMTLEEFVTVSKEKIHSVKSSYAKNIIVGILFNEEFKVEIRDKYQKERYLRNLEKGKRILRLLLADKLITEDSYIYSVCKKIPDRFAHMKIKEFIAKIENGEINPTKESDHVVDILLSFGFEVNLSPLDYYDKTFPANLYNGLFPIHYPRSIEEQKKFQLFIDSEPDKVINQICIDLSDKRLMTHIFIQNKSVEIYAKETNLLKAGVRKNIRANLERMRNYYKGEENV